MDTLKKLQELFKRFPGIGNRQAMRFAYFLATANPSYVKELTESIELLRKNVRRCARCYALSEDMNEGLCTECKNTDTSMLLVVEKDADKERFVQSKTYKGSYFVLGGLVPMIEKEIEKYMRLNELVSLVNKENPQEVILALSATPDGERTMEILKEKIKGPTVSVLGRGLSTGTEIEYSDGATLLSALESRR